MGHVRKDTLVGVEWARHLRPFGKRVQAKKERQAARRHIRFAEAERSSSSRS